MWLLLVGVILVKDMEKRDLKKLRDIPIVLLLGLHDKGRRVQVRCPFHNERDASFTIYPDNSWHCYGCGAHGKGAIDFVVKLGYSIPDAIKELEGLV